MPAVRGRWEGGSDARYLPTGHIVYAQGNTLLAFPFDLDTRTNHDWFEELKARVPVQQSISLQPGTTLGPYQIQSQLGAAGMGEVHKARDTRPGPHGRHQGVAGSVDGQAMKWRV